MEGLCECGCGEKAPIAEATDPRFGWVKGQPKRFVSGHNRRRTPHDYVEEDRGYKTPCWIWQRALNNKGYGIKQTYRRSTTAHRWYYEEHVSPIPKGMEVDHLCRVHPCVNPSHMEVVTPAENRYRGKNAKLTRDQVRIIRESKLAKNVLVEMFGVSRRTIYDIQYGHRWKEII